MPDHAICRCRPDRGEKAATADHVIFWTIVAAFGVIFGSACYTVFCDFVDTIFSR